jgi:beta-lactamase regulating signal transducer with metallopeptidase domain
MNQIVETFVQPLANSVSPVLIHSLWQGILIAFLLKAVLTVIHTRRARMRYVIASTAMAMIVALCVFTGVQSIRTDSVVVPALTDTNPADDVASILPSGSVKPEMTPPHNLPISGLTISREQIERWAIPFWIAGIFLLTLRHVIGYGRARRLVHSGTRSVPAEWTTRFDRLCADLRVSRPVRLLGSAIVKVPCVVGWFKPVILFPVSSLAALNVSDVEMILAHELSHIRRNDVLINIAQIVIETLLFFNPAVWWISRQMRIEREHCCDDLAIAITGDRLDYARALVNLEETRQTAPGYAVAATATGIVARVRRIVLHQSPRDRAANMGVIGMLILAAVLIAGAITIGGPATSDVVAATAFEPIVSYDPSPSDIKGKWSIESWDEWSQVEIRLRRNWQTSFSVRTSDLLKEIGVSTTQFQMKRDAGTFHFKGRFDRDDDELWGNGECYFRPNGFYVREMKSLGYDLKDDEDAMVCAVHDITLKYIQDMAGLGYGNLPFDDLMAAHIHDVTPEYIDELDKLGYSGIDLDDLVAMQIHDVDPGYIRELDDLGYTDLKPGRLVELSIHDVDAGFVRELSEAGYSDLDPERLVEMSIHDVEPQYIRSLREMGYTDLSPSDLVEMSIHDVDAGFIRKMADLGYTDLSKDDLVAMSIHDIDADFVDELAQLGYKDLNPDRLVELSIHDVDAEYIRAMTELGYGDLSPQRLVEMDIHDVEPEYVASLQKMGYTDLPASKLVEMQIHDIDIDYIEELAELGYDDLSPSKLVEMSIHDVSPRYIRALAELGYDDLSPSQLVEMSIHDVTPSFVRRMQEREGKDISVRRLIKFKIHGLY